LFAIATSTAEDNSTFLEYVFSGLDDPVMSRERVRRCITFFLLILLAAVALRGGEGKDVALTLGPIGALLVIAMRFYFTPSRKENSAKWRRISHLDLRDRRDSNPAPPA